MCEQTGHLWLASRALTVFSSFSKASRASSKVQISSRHSRWMLPCFISSRKELALRSRRSTECAASAGRNTGRQMGERMSNWLRERHLHELTWPWKKQRVAIEASGIMEGKWEGQTIERDNCVVRVPGKDKKAERWEMNHSLLRRVLSSDREKTKALLI